jgi:hypothetical protein
LKKRFPAGFCETSPPASSRLEIQMNLARQLNDRNAETRRQYVKLLHTFEDGNAKHLAALDQLRMKLGISPEQVHADFAVICDVRRLNDQIDARAIAAHRQENAEAERRVLESFQAHQEFEAKWRKEHEQLHLAASHARSAFTAMIQARNDALAKLQDYERKRPDLILQSDPDPDPPRRAA